MADSLVIGGIIELLAGGVAEDHPQAAGAYFRLGTGFDLGAPQITSEQVAGMLLDGEVVSGFRASNRTPNIPVTMYVLPTGDDSADRATLAGARELLLQITSQEHWELTWTREGAEPLIFDCMGLSSVVVHYSIRTEQALFSQVEVTFQAFPYGRSDVPEQLDFNAPAAIFPAPPSVVTVDDFTVAVNYLTGDSTGFESTVGTWLSASNCTVARSTAQFHSGAASLALTSSAVGNMSARMCADPVLTATGGVTTTALRCRPGDTIRVSAWFRAATVARACAVGVQFWTAAAASTGAATFSTTTNDTTTGWTQVTATFTAPSTAAWVTGQTRVSSAAGAGEVHYTDDISVDRGTVYSAVDGQQWVPNTSAASGATSAYWSRVMHDNPIYDHSLSAPLDITGRTKWTFWLGLSTSTTQWRIWHQGTVHFAVTLYDGSGGSVSFGIKRTCQASALPNRPHWQFISVHIPQLSTGFDYTTVTRYVINVWNVWDTKIKTGPVVTGGRALLANAYLNFIQAVPAAIGSPVNRGAWYTLPGIVGTARSPLAIQAAPGPSSFSTVTEFTTAGSNPWTAPAGLTKVDKAEAWGAGAGGAGSQSNSHNNGAGGGGAGEYAMEINVPVVALSSYPFVVGAAGAGGSAGNAGVGGGDSYWSGASGRQLYANGGSRGWSSQTWGGGKGGTGSGNYLHYDGGDGDQANVNNDSDGRGGGGGSSGGTSQAGDDGGWGGDVRNPGRARTGGGPGGMGGNKDGSGPGFNGNVPSTGPGGGGGGGANESGNAGFHGGSAGRGGKGRLTYGATGLFPLSSLLVHMPGRNAPDTFVPLVPVGGGADSPSGAIEYLVPDVGNLNARFDGTYTLYLVAGTWNSPASPRDLTVQLRQYPYTGGTALTQPVVRKGVVPSTDITNGFVDMGPVTLPLAQLSPGALDSYFALTVLSSNLSDRMLDVILIDSQGTFLLVSVPGTSVWNNIWIDPPDPNRGLGLPLGSPADRDQASSLLQYVDRLAGGPLSVHPDHLNRILVYSAQGAPAFTASYTPQWWTERLA